PQDRNGITGTVTANSLSVRSGASLNTKLIGTVTKGLSFTILEEKNNWAKIEYQSGSFGWVAGWYLDKQAVTSPSGQAVKESIITIINNGTNIRKSPNVQSDVVERVNKGVTFSVKSLKNDWYEVKTKNGKTGYVAGWLVSINGNAPQIEKPGAEEYIKNKTIVLDPGHGGTDKGATGTSGTYEKELTLRTAMLLYDKLRAAGANVYLTRKNDSYLQLASRVSVARTYNADAFISLHYDSNLDHSVRGMTSYYYHSYQKALADTLFASTIGQTKLTSRGVRFGDFHVIRENSQNAALMELGYLSNPEEEMTLKSGGFQENAASGLFDGLARYFKEN
ncbi:MAG: N-acetylmuramoyl-L-alanine amidase, partial [Bacillus sp. (in: firmicutes)]